MKLSAPTPPGVCNAGHLSTAALALLVLLGQNAPVSAASLPPTPSALAVKILDERVDLDRLADRRIDGTPVATHLAGLPVLDSRRLFPATPSARARNAFERHGLDRIVRIDLRAGTDLDAAARDLRRIPGVAWAEPIPIFRLTALTDDPYLHSSNSWGQGYQDLWGHHLIGVGDAWDSATGDGVLVAVIDSGLDSTHEDFAGSGKVWIHPGEIPSNGVDDDGNGFVDDVNGWDFHDDDANPVDGFGHGTHVAGTLAATGDDGYGIAGVAHGSTILPLKVTDANGFGGFDTVAEAIVYAANEGADVINLSLGLPGFYDLVEDALAFAYDQGVVVVAAAGNDNVDATAFHPASSRYVVTVGASDRTDDRSSFSNRGPALDLVAPGGDSPGGRGAPPQAHRNVLGPLAAASSMAADLIVGDHLRLAGTSMAAPHVAGVAALLLESDPSATPEEIRQQLRRGAAAARRSEWDPEIGFGRLNAAASLALDGRGSARMLSPRAGVRIARNGALVVEVRGTATARNLDSWTLELGEGANPTSWIEVASSSTPVVDGLLASWDPAAVPDGSHLLRLRVVAGDDVFVDHLPISIGNVTHDEDLACWGAAASETGTLWSNGGSDLVLGLPTHVDSVQGHQLEAADDFVIPEGCSARLSEVRVHMNVAPFTLGSGDPVERAPSVGRLRVFPDAGGEPAADPAVEHEFEVWPELVGWFGVQLCFPILEYSIPLDGVRLEPGTYWLSPYGLPEPELGATAWGFRSAGYGWIQGEEARFKDSRWSANDWTPAGEHAYWLYRMSTDLAFEIDGECGLFLDGFESGDVSAWK